MGKFYIQLRLLMCVSALFVSQALYAQSVVNYLNFHGTADSEDKSFLIDNIKKITFSEESMELIMENGQESMPYTNFSLITLTEVAISSGVEETLTDGGDFVVKYNKSIQELEVCSSFPIISLQMYSLQGKLIKTISSQALLMHVSLADYPSGIYIMRVSNGKSVVSQKIVKH